MAHIHHHHHHHHHLLLLVLLLIIFRDSHGCSEVKYLPGYPGPLPFELETGYIGVDEGENVELFYYFVKSGTNPQKDPLILWLPGGPGCSVLSALVYEIGPISFEEEYDDDDDDDGGLPTLILNPYSWTQEASIIFVDLPVGTGFSYGKTPHASHSTGLQFCYQVYQFLRKWLLDHPDFISNPFYVAGESYVGVPLPAIVQMISNGRAKIHSYNSLLCYIVNCLHVLSLHRDVGNEMGIEPRINLKGYLLGNPLTFPDTETNYMIPYAHGMGFISHELYTSLKRNCKGEYTNVDPRDVMCVKDVETFHKLVDDLYTPEILEPKCKRYAPRPFKLSGERRYLVLEDNRQEIHNNEIKLKCHTDMYRLAPLWVNDPSVREALHIHKGSVESWTRCNSDLPFTDELWDSTPYHANLSAKGCYRSLIYSGDHDMIVTHLSTQAWIRSLNYPIVEEWRQWLVQGQIAGYTRTYANNMTFATVKGGGHTAPEYRPMECAAMFKRWISYQSL